MDNSDESVIEIPNPKVKAKIINIQMEKGVSTEQKMIVFGQQGKVAGWSVDSRLRTCSQFLQCLQQQKQLDSRVVLCFNLPPNLKVNSNLISLIEGFYHRHNYNPQDISIKKITIQGYKKALDSVTLSYLEDVLEKESQETIRNLLNLSEYLKMNDFKQLLTVFIASQYFFDFNDKTMQKKIIEAGAFYSRQEQIVLGHKLRPYAQQVGTDLLQSLRNKYSVMGGQHRPTQ